MRVGIITMYHGSCNCGGCLQAYALCKVISDMGYDVEQIRFSIPGKRIDNSQPPKKGCPPLAGLFHKVTYKILHYHEIKARKAVKEKTDVTFEHWRNKYVPQSDVVYTKETIHTTTGYYDAFITGSDQVWNLKWYNPTRFLDFVPSSMTKIAYAASVCMNAFSAEQKELVRGHLEDFNAISVRERASIPLIEEVSPVPVQATLDPTLLLSAKEWDEIASDRLVQEDYVFCYFLGEDAKQRKLATDFAREKGLKLAILESVEGRLSKQDKHFGNRHIKYGSPSDFISLIKHAEYVFTDSFHASVFSGLYEKELFVFPRAGEGAMSSRLYTLSRLFGFADHFCDTDDKITLEHINGLDRIDYAKERPLFVQMKGKSLDFLKNSINAAEAMTKS